MDRLFSNSTTRVSADEIAREFGINKSSIYYHINNNSFPQQHMINGDVFWCQSEVISWAYNYESKNPNTDSKIVSRIKAVKESHRQAAAIYQANAALRKIDQNNQICANQMFYGDDKKAEPEYIDDGKRFCASMVAWLMVLACAYFFFIVW